MKHIYQPAQSHPRAGRPCSIIEPAGRDLWRIEFDDGAEMVVPDIDLIERDRRRDPAPWRVNVVHVGTWLTIIALYTALYIVLKARFGS